MSDRVVDSNLWESKPWWCQPWTIILTGVGLIVGSWLLLKSLWVTVPLTFAIVIWWTYFLIIVPRLLRQMVEESNIRWRSLSERKSSELANHLQQQPIDADSQTIDRDLD